jgi:hypothetical protein
MPRDFFNGLLMLLLAISFWTGGSRWTDRLLWRMMPKGGVAVGAIMTALFIAIGVVGVADPGLRIIGVLGLFLGLVTFVFLVAVPVVALIREKIQVRPSQHK